MELFDYLRSRWKAASAILALGVLGIVTVGLRSEADYFTAEAQLLVRPPSNQVAAYASDLDRYIDTEMTLIYTPDYLSAEVGDTGVAPAQLRDVLSYRHEPGSDEVYLLVSAPTAEAAVELVNAAAEGYVNVSSQRGGTLSEESTATLDAEIDEAESALARANRAIKRAGLRFSAANPDQGVPAPTTLSPDAAVQQSLSLARLQALNARETQLSLDAASIISRSQLLARAQSAVSPQGWGLTTYGAALAGLVLVLLTLAGVGLALTRRVLSPSRWAAATADGCIRSAIRVRGLRSRPSIRRVVGYFARSGSAAGAPIVVYFPKRTRSLANRNAHLLKAMSEEGIVPKEIGSLAAITTADTTDPDDPIMLVVDLAKATFDDAGLLNDYPETVQRRIVPVLL